MYRVRVQNSKKKELECINEDCGGSKNIFEWFVKKLEYIEDM
jgi:hypothetical protein